jgi:hypothetical protein
VRLKTFVESSRRVAHLSPAFSVLPAVRLCRRRRKDWIRRACSVTSPAAAVICKHINNARYIVRLASRDPSPTPVGKAYRGPQAQAKVSDTGVGVQPLALQRGLCFIRSTARHICGSCPSTCASDWCWAGYQHAEGHRKQFLPWRRGLARDAVFCPLCSLQEGLAVESGDEARGGVGTASHLKRNRAAPCPLGCDTAGGMPISTFRRLEECFETASSGVSLYLDTFNLLPSSTCVPLVVNRGWVHPLQHGGHVVEPFRCHHGAGVDPHRTWPELRR